MKELEFNFQADENWGPTYLSDETYFGPIKPVRSRLEVQQSLPVADFLKHRKPVTEDNDFQNVAKIQQTPHHHHHHQYKKRYFNNRRYHSSKKKTSAVSKTHDKEMQKQMHRMKKMKTQKLRARRRNTMQWRKPQNQGGSSVEIKTTWESKIQYVFAQLFKKEIPVPEAETMYEAGYIKEFNKKYNTITSSNPVTLVSKGKKNFYSTTASEDPILLKYAEEKKGNVFLSAKLMSLIMASTRTVLSWDVVVTKKDGVIFFDKRDKMTRVDIMTVDETSAKPPKMYHEKKGPIDSAFELGKEATIANLKFSQLVTDSKKKQDFSEANPFAKQGDKPAGIGFRYRKFQVSPTITAIIRCEVDGFIDNTAKIELKKRFAGEDEEVNESPYEYLAIRALNEFHHKRGQDYRSLIDTHVGRVMITEVKNNSAKLSRWVSQATLADCDTLKIGFISRSNPKNNKKHVIVRVDTHPVDQLASQIGLKMRNAWGIFEDIVSQIQELDDGKYILVKMANKQRLQLYRISTKMVGTLVFRHNQDANVYEFMLLTNKDDQFEFVSGTQDKSELEVNTAKRLLKSECNLDEKDVLYNKEFKYHNRYHDENTNEEKTDVMFLCFLPEDSSANISVDSDKYSSLEWIEWNPPHSIQGGLIDNSLEYLADQLQSTSLKQLYKNSSH